MLRIQNWAEYQHYKDRNPPWIKLHFALLSSADWVALADASRVLAIACMLIASRNEGRVDASDKGLSYLQRVAYLNSPPDLNPLIECGFLICDDCLLADASDLQADACSESESEERQRQIGSPLSQNESKSGQTPTSMIRNMAIERGMSWDAVLAHAGGEPPWPEDTITALKQYLQPMTKYTDQELDARRRGKRGSGEPELLSTVIADMDLRAGRVAT